MTDQPTNAEIARRLDDAVNQVRHLAATLESSYVRKDVYEARHAGLRREQEASVKEVAEDVAEIKRKREKDADRWKQAMFAIGCTVILLLIQGALSVSNFMARTSGGS